LEANPDYWDGQPSIKTLTFKPIPEPSVRAMALSKGEINYAAGLTAEDFANLQDDSNVQTFSVPQLRFAYLGQNNQNPLFKDLKVRQAMAYAVDQDTVIRDIMQGAAEPCTGPIAAINSEWYNPNVKTYDYNPELSKQLLAEAGWTAGSDGILVKDGERFSFTTRLSSGNELMKNQAILLQNWLKAVGIEMNLEFLDTSLFYDYLDNRDYEGMMLSMGPSPDPDQFNYWHSSSIKGGFNDWCYSNPEVDQLLEQGRKESDPAKRKVIYDRFQEIMAEDVAAIWLYHPNSLSAITKGYTGMTAEPAGQYQFLYKVTASK
jgi:peptide/nickel transport system substrate-binding protein